MAKTTAFDASEYLDNDETIQAFIAEAFETGDAKVIASSLGDVAKARGMSELARQTGLSRESLYKSLSADGNPAFSTILNVMKALGLNLEPHPKAKAPELA